VAAGPTRSRTPRKTEPNLRRRIPLAGASLVPRQLRRLEQFLKRRSQTGIFLPDLAEKRIVKIPVLVMLLVAALLAGLSLIFLVLKH
jgi:hypothetical protein